MFCYLEVQRSLIFSLVSTEQKEQKVASSKNVINLPVEMLFSLFLLTGFDNFACYFDFVDQFRGKLSKRSLYASGTGFSMFR